jgi:hypothetical protein
VDKVRFARSAPGVTFKDDGIYVRCNHRYDLQRFGLTEQGVYRFTEKVEFYIGQDSINLT